MPVKKKVVLATNAGVGNTASFQCEGGNFKFSATATWGGGNIKLQQKGSDNVTWIDISGATMAADSIINVVMAAGEVRAVITTATGVYAELVPAT